LVSVQEEGEEEEEEEEEEGEEERRRRSFICVQGVRSTSSQFPRADHGQICRASHTHHSDY